MQCEINEEINFVDIRIKKMKELKNSKDLKKIIYITRVHGPFEKITGVTIFVFHLPGGRIYVPIGDKNKAEGYVKKWAKHIQ